MITRRIVLKYGGTLLLTPIWPVTQVLSWPEAKGSPPSTKESSTFKLGTVGVKETGDASTNKQAPAEGCLLKSTGKLNLGESVTERERVNPTLVRKGKAFNMDIGNILMLRPGFGFYGGEDSTNAYATPRNIFEDSRDGTIILGLNLVKNEIKKGPYSWQGAITFIHAHEFAHIAQYNYDYNEGPTPLKELHADAMGGLIMGHLVMTKVLMERRLPWRIRLLRAERRRREIVHAAQSIFSFGDYKFNNPNHHGTPRQRLKAFKIGYKFLFRKRGQITTDRALQVTHQIGERVYQHY